MPHAGYPWFSVWLLRICATPKILTRPLFFGVLRHLSNDPGRLRIAWHTWRVYDRSRNYASVVAGGTGSCRQFDDPDEKDLGADDSNCIFCATRHGILTSWMVCHNSAAPCTAAVADLLMNMTVGCLIFPRASCIYCGEFAVFCRSICLLFFAMVCAVYFVVSS